MDCATESRGDQWRGKRVRKQAARGWPLAYVPGCRHDVLLTDAVSGSPLWNLLDSVNRSTTWHSDIAMAGLASSPALMSLNQLKAIASTPTFLPSIGGPIR